MSDPCCEQPPDAQVTVASPVTLAGVFEVATLPFDDPLNLVLPVPRRQGYYAGLLGISYSRDDGGVAVSTPLHAVRIAFEELNDAGATFLGNGKYLLLNQEVRFFSILSDGERSIVPPFVGGGANPYGLVVTSVGVVGQLGTLRAYFRFMPRTNAYPALPGRG